MKCSSSSSEWDWEFESITTTDYRREDIIIPEWVSFEPIEFQIIWQDTAGKRKIQPRKEREKFEEIWLKNKLDNSGKNYLMFKNWISGKNKKDNDFKNVEKISRCPSTEDRCNN